jgi:hypothetical protein
MEEQKNPFLEESRLETSLIVDKAFELSIKYSPIFNWEDLKNKPCWEKYTD